LFVPATAMTDRYPSGIVAARCALLRFEQWSVRLVLG
jgi:hypothetical protein